MPWFVSTRFEYYLLQARHGVAEGTPQVRVALEDLASGDRWDFQSPAELARFIESGERASSSVGPGTGPAPAPTQAQPPNGG